MQPTSGVGPNQQTFVNVGAATVVQVPVMIPEVTHRRSQTRWGFVQVAIGSTVIILEIITKIVADFIEPHFISNGIIFVVAGICGIQAGQRCSKCWMITGIVFSIISCIGSFTGFIRGINVTWVLSSYITTSWLIPRIVLHSILYLLEFIAANVQSSYGYSDCCGCCCARNFDPNAILSTHEIGTPQQQIVVHNAQAVTPAPAANYPFVEQPSYPPAQGYPSPHGYQPQSFVPSAYPSQAYLLQGYPPQAHPLPAYPQQDRFDVTAEQGCAGGQQASALPFKPSLSEPPPYDAIN